MKRLKWMWVLFCAVALLVFSGCSYKELDNQLQDTIQQKMDDSTDGQTYVEIPSQPEDQIEYKGAEESFSAYKKYTVTYAENEEVETEKGNEGLTYTLKSVTTYASIYEADVDMYGCMLADNEDFVGKNAFILIDIQASYAAPAGGEPEIIADAGQLSGTCLEEKMTQQAAEGIRPMLVYFSMRPKEDDPKLDYQHQFFSYLIQDGQSIDFQVGLFCAQEYIDDKNVFLEVNEVPSIDGEVTGDTARKLFVLFPEGGD